MCVSTLGLLFKGLFRALHLNIAVFMIKDTYVYERHARMRAVLL